MRHVLRWPVGTRRREAAPDVVKYSTTSTIGTSTILKNVLVPRVVYLMHSQNSNRIESIWLRVQTQQHVLEYSEYSSTRHNSNT
jgi:hypothetical protein